METGAIFSHIENYHSHFLYGMYKTVLHFIHTYTTKIIQSFDFPVENCSSFNFIASCMLPEIFSLPVRNACNGNIIILTFSPFHKVVVTLSKQTNANENWNENLKRTVQLKDIKHRDSKCTKATISHAYDCKDETSQQNDSTHAWAHHLTI